jgi:2-keto-4-pentenoate hydratase/2-oxohepta-3-ene-1,7-dioic acid hydratase in catechol pathway
MFALKDGKWHCFERKAGIWHDTGSKSFDEAIAGKAVDNFDLPISSRNGLEPAFSGSKILCVGRNYLKHAQELGNDVPSRPLWFSKPPSAIIGDGGEVELPEGFGRIDYEGELVLVIGRRCRNVSLDKALDYIGGVTAGFDMTARDLQKSDGQWTRAKGFDTFLPLASVVAPFCEEWRSATLEVRLNSRQVQYSSLTAMVFGFAELIADISACMTLEPGDLIMTGTPEGVGPVKSGDRLEMTISGPCVIDLSVSCR